MQDYDSDYYEDEGYDDYYDDYYEDSDCDPMEYEPDFDPFDEDYYSAWDEAVNPPHWYTCRECNGVGHDPYGMPCEKCNHTGVKYAIVHSFIYFFNRLKNSDYRSFVPFHRCSDCGSWYWSFTKYPFCPDDNCPGSFPF